MTGRVLVDTVASYGVDPKVGKKRNGVHVNGGAPMGYSIAAAEPEEFDDEELTSGDDDKVWNYVEEIPITEIDERDVGTADDWIPRHPDLVRLTGRHPFNCEPPLPDLMKVSKALESNSISDES